MANALWKKILRVLAVLLCVLMVATIAVSAVYLISSMHHDCCGEHCLICCYIRRCGELLRSLVRVPAAAALTAAASYCAAVFCVFLTAAFTLTAQYVRLND